MLRPWARAAFAMLAVGWGANQFASLLLAYREHAGLSASSAAALFGFYAVGLIPALLVVGPLSDRLGRQRIARVAVLVSLAGTGVLMLGDLSVWSLYPGRFIAGVASGMVFAPGTAWVKELSGPGAASLGARRSAVALSSGFSLGPLVAGVVSQWAPAPLVSPYLAHLLVGTLAAVLVWNTPETVAAQTVRRPVTWVPHSLAEPRFRRVVMPLGPWVFTAASVSITLGPSLVARETGAVRIAFAGIIAGLTLGTGVLVQPLARRLDERSDARAITAGLLGVAGGALALLVAALAPHPAWVVLAAVLFGAGYGCCLVAGLMETQRIARPDEQASLTAVYYALTYLGFGAPFVLAELNRHLAWAVVLPALAALAVLSLLWILVSLVSLRPRSGAGSPGRDPGVPA